LVNLGTGPATITATQTDQDGEEITEEDLVEDLAPNAKVRVVFGDVLEDRPASLIEVESDQPFAVVSLRGTAPGIQPGVLWANTPFTLDDCNEDFEAAPAMLTFEELKLLIEHNAADEDTGFQCFADGDPWVDLEIEGPGGEIFSSSAEGSFLDFGVTELFFETSEPENAEVPIADVLALLPEGTYTATATMVDGSTSSVTTEFTHTIPGAAAILTPEDGAENVDPAGVVVSWTAVTTDLEGSSDITIAGYQVIVEAAEETANPEGFVRAEFNAYLPASVTSIAIPAEFMESGKAYEIEVLAIEESGNQTISISEFFTTSEFEPEEPEEPEGLKDGKMLIEHNSSDEDTGFQGFGDGDPWNELEISGPNGVFVDFSAEGSLEDFGLTEIFFETSEPENRLVPIADVLARLPEGSYTYTGDIVDGEESEFMTSLTHVIPMGPELLTPEDGNEEVDSAETVVSWNPVTEALDGSAVTIVGYQVIVELDEEPEFPQGFAHPALFLYVPASVTSVSIPPEFMQADAEYEYEVLAIEASGNQTLTAAEFETEGD